MKLKHLFFNALAVISFAACSSEAEEIKPADKSTTATLQLDMTGQYGSGNSDQTRALSLDGTEYPRFIHEEGVTDWSTHCFIRNEAGTVQFYALVDWNATTDSDGNISLHIKNSTLTLQNSAGSDVSNTETLPKAGERWYIAGIAGGGVLDATNSNVNFNYTKEVLAGVPIFNWNRVYPDTQDGEAARIRVPIAFGWTRFTIPSNTERAPQIVVQFQPQGTLLSVYVDNTTNVNAVPLNAAVKITSNALSQNGVFDYALEADRETYTTAPKWTFTSETATSEVITRSLTIAANTGANCYVWAMPRTTAPAEGFSTTAGVAGYTYFADGSQTQKPQARTSVLQKGRTYVLPEVDVYTPLLPHQFLTEYNIGTDKATFAPNHSPATQAFCNWNEAMEKFKSTTIDGVKYHLPSVGEWVGIFASHYGDGNYLRFNAESSFDNLREGIEIAGYKDNFYSDYRGTANNIGYALRYKKDGDNSRLTAVRYEYADNPENAKRKLLKVTFRYLGTAGAATTADAIASEDYWASNNQDDATFIFPASGFRSAEGTYHFAYNYGWYWTSSHRWNADFNAGTSETRYYNRLDTDEMSIRLFKDEL